MEDISGTVLLDKYRIEGMLGQGGMGSVFRGEHVRTGRKVAVKLLDERFLSNASVVQRFGREARAASAIQHPGIVEVLDLDQTRNGIPFLVMEFLPGYALSTRIETKGRLSLDETMDIMAQLLDALDAAHEHGVVHRDLKPDNIILTPRKRRSDLLKILDFGISQKSDERASNLTVAGTVLGTPHYMAPEQAMGDAGVDRRADLYAAGIVMYECLVGDVPFDADNYNALIHVILNEEPTPPRTRGAQIGKNLERAILTCLAKNKDERPATAAQMLQLLRDARNKDELAPPEPDTRSNETLPAVDPAVTAAAMATPSSPLPPQKSPKPSLADGELVIAPTGPRRSKKPARPATSLSPAADDDGYDPFMETGGNAADFELDESVLDSDTGSIRASRAKSLASPSPSPVISHRAPPRDISLSKAPPEPKRGPVALYVVGVLLFVAAGIFAARAFLSGDDTGPTPTPMVEETHPPQPEADAGAAIVEDGRVSVDVSGLPPGATVHLDGLPAGNFPLRLRRGSSHTLRISAPGYEEREVRFTAEEDQRIRGNLRPATGAVP